MQSDWLLRSFATTDGMRNNIHFHLQVNVAPIQFGQNAPVLATAIATKVAKLFLPATVLVNVDVSAARDMSSSRTIGRWDASLRVSAPSAKIVSWKSRNFIIDRAKTRS